MIADLSTADDRNREYCRFILPFILFPYLPSTPLCLMVFHFLFTLCYVCLCVLRLDWKTDDRVRIIPEHTKRLNLKWAPRKVRKGPTLKRQLLIQCSVCTDCLCRLMIREMRSICDQLLSEVDNSYVVGTTVNSSPVYPNVRERFIVIIPTPSRGFYQ